MQHAQFLVFVACWLMAAGRFTVPGHVLSYAGTFEAISHIVVGMLLLIVLLNPFRMALKFFRLKGSEAFAFEFVSNEYDKFRKFTGMCLAAVSFLELVMAMSVACAQDQFTVEVLPFVQRFTVVVIEPAKVVERRPPVVAAPVVPVRRQRYLVSEPWCGHCPAAKKRFLGIGWPDSNVITIDECERRFGFRPKSIPYEFDEPVQSPSVKAVKPVKTSLRSMSHREMVQLHNNLHGGIPHTWPGDLATHLQTVHGQY